MLLTEVRQLIFDFETQDEPFAGSLLASISNIAVYASRNVFNLSLEFLR